jgi:hypothetical protein
MPRQMRDDLLQVGQGLGGAIEQQQRVARREVRSLLLGILRQPVQSHLQHPIPLPPFAQPVDEHPTIRWIGPHNGPSIPAHGLSRDPWASRGWAAPVGQ